MKCLECYSEYSRITPLKGVKECLTKHKQYVCSTCGRAICIDVKGEKKARCFYPFSSLNNAILYLKVAEILTGELCGIYELIYKRGDIRYKIFASITEFEFYLKKNPNVKSKKNSPIYISEKYQKINSSQIKYLTQKEREKYNNEKTFSPSNHKLKTLQLFNLQPITYNLKPIT